MSDESRDPSRTGNTGDTPPKTDAELETLRDILFRHDRQQITDLRSELDELERRVTDEEALIATVTPVLGDAIRRKIRDSRAEMIEALYPIIGQLVVRAVSEAIRDLARTMDAQVRTSFDPRVMWWRLRARLGGASDAEMRLREALPFEVTEIFLIHRETGLLLRHISRDPEAASDSDLISSMLTAIRDFAHDAFGRGQEGHLEEIEYGERRILIETAQRAYLAVVVDGIEPPGFRGAMREQIIEVNHTYEGALRDYDGNPTPLAPAEGPLRSLMTGPEPAALSSTQKRILAGALGVGVICLVVSCLAGRWGWQAVQGAPALPATSTPTAAATPTATGTPTATRTPTLTRTPVPTSTPETVMALMTGNVWVRQGPSASSPRLGVVLARGQPVEITAAFGDWYRVRWTSESQAEIVGWVPVEWVGMLTPVPSRMITPTAGPQ